MALTAKVVGALLSLYHCEITGFIQIPEIVTIEKILRRVGVQYIQQFLGLRSCACCLDAPFETGWHRLQTRC